MTKSMTHGNPDRWTLRRVRVAVETRVRQGWGRTRSSFLPIVEASVAAAVAFWLARHLLGHEYPFFAAVAAWVCLGFTANRQLRKVLEVAAGVIIGIALGELFAHLLGRGAWQIGVVLLIAGLGARFIDRGAVIVTQAGVQSIVVIAVPAMNGQSEFGRVSDALVGGLVALVVAVLLPGDPRRRARPQARAGFGELAVVLDSLVDAIGRFDVDAVDDALERARRTPRVLDEWGSTLRSARETGSIAPALRRYRGEFASMQRAWERLDRALRTTRVIARRCIALCDEKVEAPHVAAALSQMADGARSIGDAFGSGTDPGKARPHLKATSAQLDAEELGAEEPEASTIVHLMRSMIVDLLEATGMPNSEARKTLPPL